MRLVLIAATAPEVSLGAGGRLAGEANAGDWKLTDVAAVEERAGHVLALAGVTLDHLVRGLESRGRELEHGVLFVLGLVARDDGLVGGEREVDTRERHQVGLRCRSTRQPGRMAKDVTRQTWNSLRSTFNEPSKRSDAVIEETT